MLYEITIPGFSVSSDLPSVRRRLRADYPRVLDVLGTTRPATLLIVYSGEDEIDAWLKALDHSVPTRDLSRALGTGSVSSAA
jgi:hypothetical protein